MVACTIQALSGRQTSAGPCCISARWRPIAEILRYWQTGYAAHSVSPSQLEAVDQYVANQEAHHTRMTFQEELRIICRKNGIELDGRVAWD